MRRRAATKNITALVAGLALFPGCSERLLIDQSDSSMIGFTDKQSIWIDAISDAILPKGEGSMTTLETFPRFVYKMISFVTSPKDQESFFNGYNLCTSEVKELHNVAVKKLTPEQIIGYFSSVLNIEEDRIKEQGEHEAIKSWDKKHFCQSLRSLAIQHFTSSKEYQEEILEYKLVPNPFQPCVEV